MSPFGLTVFFCLGGFGQESSELPKPGEHHQHLKALEGTWDAKVEFPQAKEGEPKESKGVETNVMGCGGFWLLSDFKSDFGGGPFEGHGVMGYDESKKKYVGVWVDSMTTRLGVSEGECDGAGKKFTSWSEGPDMTGKTVKWKTVDEFKDADTRAFAMSIVGDGGKETVVMTIQYKRRKK